MATKEAVKENELLGMVKTYLRLERDYADLRRGKENLEARRPIPPKVFESIGEMDVFKAATDNYSLNLTDIERKKTGLIDAIDKLKAQIIDMLTIKNVWLKVGEYGVGFYRCTWGGGHFELSTIPWQEQMPELDDHTYYP